MAKYVFLTLALSAAYALVLGAIGFCAGFFGPMYLDPTSGNGPLLGIFITGPGGFLLGLLVGIAHGLYLMKKNQR